MSGSRKYQLWITVFFCLQLFSIKAVAESGRSIAYDEINDMLLYLQKHVKSPFVKARMFVKPTSDKVKLSDVKLWLISGKQQLKNIDIAENGDISLPTYPADEAGQYSLRINRKKGEVSVSMAIAIDLGEKTEVSYYNLFIILDDVNNYMAKMAGMASWFIPDRDRLKFIFSEPASIKIVMENRIKTYKTNNENIIRIDRKKKLMKKNPKVIFSSKPTEISPEN